MFISVRKKFLSKAFSMSETDIHQILNLNYYKKLQAWRTHDVDGFNLYRNTESSITLFKRWRGDYKKEEYNQIYQQCFYLEELTRIEWLISKKQNNGRAYKTGDEEFQFDY